AGTNRQCACHDRFASCPSKTCVAPRAYTTGSGREDAGTRGFYRRHYALLGRAVGKGSLRGLIGPFITAFQCLNLGLQLVDSCLIEMVDLPGRDSFLLAQLDHLALVQLEFPG